MKSFSIFGNLFTIPNSLNMERKGGTPMQHPFYFAFIWFKVQGSGFNRFNRFNGFNGEGGGFRRIFI